MNDDSWKPNLFVAGFAKSGSTALVDYLKQHPDIFVPKIKEPSTLSKLDDFPELVNNPKVIRLKDWKLSFDEYKKLYSNATNYKHRVDGSQVYTSEKNIAEYIKNFSPNAKVLLIIREPKERTISKYLASYNIHSADFKKWLESYFLPYIDSFLTYSQVVEYYKTFKDNLRVIRNEELKTNPKTVMNEIFRYLGLEPIDVKQVVSHASRPPLENIKNNIRLTLVLKSLYIVRKISEPLGLLDTLRRRFNKQKRSTIHNIVKKNKNEIYKSYLETFPKYIAEVLDDDYSKTIEFINKNNIILGMTKTEHS